MGRRARLAEPLRAGARRRRRRQDRGADAVLPDPGRQALVRRPDLPRPDAAARPRMLRARSLAEAFYARKFAAKPTPHGRSLVQGVARDFRALTALTSRGARTSRRRRRLRRRRVAVARPRRRRIERLADGRCRRDSRQADVGRDHGPASLGRIGALHLRRIGTAGRARSGGRRTAKRLKGGQDDDCKPEGERAQPCAATSRAARCSSSCCATRWA